MDQTPDLNSLFENWWTVGNFAPFDNMNNYTHPQPQASPSQQYATYPWTTDDGSAQTTDCQDWSQWTFPTTQQTSQSYPAPELDVPVASEWSTSVHPQSFPMSNAGSYAGSSIESPAMWDSSASRSPSPIPAGSSSVGMRSPEQKAKRMQTPRTSEDSLSEKQLFRKAQNRAAQQAHRERKKKLIEELWLEIHSLRRQNGQLQKQLQEKTETLRNVCEWMREEKGEPAPAQGPERSQSERIVRTVGRN